MAFGQGVKITRLIINKMNTKEILKADVYSEEFLTHFREVLAKFVMEYDDISQMTLIREAKELLETIDNG